MVLKSCDKKPTPTAAASATNSAGAVETGVERLPKDVTVNGGIHVNAVTSVAQNSTAVVSSAPTAVSSTDEMTQKHVINCHLLIFTELSYTFSE